MSTTLYIAKPSSVRVILVSPPSWMIQILLLEKGVDHEMIELDFARGEHRSPVMRAKNPDGTIPVFEHRHTVLNDSHEILHYIDDTFPEPAFLPRELDAKKHTLERFDRAEQLKAHGMALFAYLMRTPEEERDPEELYRLGLRFEATLPFWEELEPGDGAFGDTPNLVDLSLFVYLATGRQLGLDLTPYSRLKSFIESFEQRPSAQATWPPDWGPFPSSCPWLPE